MSAGSGVIVLAVALSPLVSVSVLVNYVSADVAGEIVTLFVNVLGKAALSVVVHTGICIPVTRLVGNPLGLVELVSVHTVIGTSVTNAVLVLVNVVSDIALKVCYNVGTVGAAGCRIPVLIFVKSPSSSVPGVSVHSATEAIVTLAVSVSVIVLCKILLFITAVVGARIPVTRLVAGKNGCEMVSCGRIFANVTYLVSVLINVSRKTALFISVLTGRSMPMVFGIA